MLAGKNFKFKLLILNTFGSKNTKHFLLTFTSKQFPDKKDDSKSINCFNPEENFELPKIIQVQPLNTAQVEVSSNVQNTDNFADIKIIVKEPVDDKEPETERANNNEAHAVVNLNPLPSCLNNNRFNKGLLSIGGIILLFVMFFSPIVTFIFNTFIFDRLSYQIYSYICACVVIVGFPTIYFVKNPGHLITAINDLPF